MSDNILFWSLLNPSKVLSLPLYSHRTMDLPYPSQKDQQLNHDMALYKKGSLLIKDSLRNIPTPPPLSASLKRQVQ